MLLPTSEKKQLLSNLWSLGSLQIVNYILPLIAIPYIVRVVGVEKFGILAVATALCMFFQVIIDYGFNLTGVKQVSIHRNNAEKLIEIFGAILTIKLILVIMSFIVLMAIILTVDQFYKYYEIYIYTFGLAVGQALFPVWFFQGMEKMKYVTLFNILAKIIFTVLLFVLVTEESDYYMVPVLTSLGFIVTGICSLIFIKVKFGFSFRIPPLVKIKNLLYDGWHVFVANISSVLYTSTITLILGIFSTDAIVGIFAAAEKIINVLKSLMHPITQVVFPYIVKITNNSKESALQFVRFIAFYSIIFYSLIFLAVLIFSEQIVYIVLGDQYKDSVELLRIMAAVPLLSTLNNILGVQIMIPFNLQKLYSSIILIGGLVSVILSFIFIPLYFQYASSYIVILVEFSLFLAMFLSLKVNNLDLVNSTSDRV